MPVGSLVGVALFIIVIYGLTGVLTGDRKGRQVQKRPSDARWYRIVLQLDAGELPFFLRLPAGKNTKGVLVNGLEEASVPVRVTDGGIVVPFEHYDSKLEATWQKGGALAGTWTVTKRGGETRVLKVAGYPVPDSLPERRFPKAPEGAASEPSDFSHVWKLQFSEGGLAKGAFRQGETGAINGTIETPTGDYRFLAGRVFGRQLFLSTFDGAHAFLFHATMQPGDNTLKGTFYSGNHWKDSFTGMRADTVELPDPMKETQLAEGFVDLGLDVLKQPPYAGQPAIVTLTGTWCPNCSDEVVVIGKLHKALAAKGLRVLGLAFEHTEDVERSKRQIAAFKAKHGVTWDILPMGTSAKDSAAAAIPGLPVVKSYPTTIWIGKNGKVHAIHTGFSGPATGHAYFETVKTFERLTDEVMGAP